MGRFTSTALLGLASGLALGVDIPHKTYECVDDVCAQQPPGTPASASLSMEACAITCGAGSLWPLPSGSYNFGGTLTPVSLDPSTVLITHTVPSAAAEAVLETMEDVFLDELAVIASRSSTASSASGLPLRVNLDVADPGAVLTLASDETYSLTTTVEASYIMASIVAPSVFGARHGLTTVAQLIAANPAGANIVIASDVTITDDAPGFPYRGVLVDTGRHFMPITQLRRTIDAMALNKMNSLHLHLSDTSAFPVELTSPLAQNVTNYGANSPDQYYSTMDIVDLVLYATARGVRIVPEVDVPAHTNQGWQWGAAAGLGDLLVCNDDAWTVKALEPPSGQLNLANENVYNVLEQVYADVVALFSSDLHHLGGDEVIVGSDDTWAACWNSTTAGAPIIAHLDTLGLDRAEPASFYELWANFTARAAAAVGRAYDAAPSDAPPLTKLIQWGGSETAPSAITYNLLAQDNVETVLPPDQFIIQVWDELKGTIAESLTKRGYEVILAHTDYTYLDCGSSGWTSPGGYWCGPYHEWYKLYGYLQDVAASWGTTAGELREAGVVGSEVLMWGEEADEQNFDSKVWPRAAALAEALWTNPEATGWYEADPRMQLQRERLVQRAGVRAEALQAQWCLANPQVCTMDSSSTPV